MVATCVTQLPAGCYLIADLCYVFSGERWDEVCDLLQSVGDDCAIYELADGTRFGLLCTAYGDGEFLDLSGASYGVDSGTIGCVLLQDLAPDVVQRFLAPRSRYSSCTSIHTITMPFRPVAEGGVLSFGHVSIDTNGWFESVDESEDPDHEDAG